MLRIYSDPRDWRRGGGRDHGPGNYFPSARTPVQPAAARQHGNTAGARARTKSKSRRRQTASVKQTHKLSSGEVEGGDGDNNNKQADDARMVWVGGWRGMAMMMLGMGW